MAHAIRFHKSAARGSAARGRSPSASPGPGRCGFGTAAVGLNFADTYFRSGFYPVPLPYGMGVEAAGVVEAIGEGVTNVAPATA
jgi:NADPH2:quinone reductase